MSSSHYRSQPYPPRKRPRGGNSARVTRFTDWGADYYDGGDRSNRSPREEGILTRLRKEFIALADPVVSVWRVVSLMGRSRGLQLRTMWTGLPKDLFPSIRVEKLSRPAFMIYCSTGNLAFSWLLLSLFCLVILFPI